jgi:NDP-sugar pyrophosphorylase family protein
MTGFKAGIIAAGSGERLKREAPGLPKPLMPVAGKPLIDWTLEALWAAKAREVVCLINEQSMAVSSYASRRWRGRPLKFMHKTTVSSYESFRKVADTLGEGKFLITTVDGIYNPLELRRFVEFAARSPWELILGLTKFVDDESPLRARMDERGCLTALGPEAEGSPYVTAGLYWCSKAAVNYHFSQGRQPAALRQFLMALLKARVPMGAFILGKVVDVDRPSDVIEAENYLKEAGIVKN